MAYIILIIMSSNKLCWAYSFLRVWWSWKGLRFVLLLLMLFYVSRTGTTWAHAFRSWWQSSHHLCIIPKSINRWPWRCYMCSFVHLVIWCGNLCDQSLIMCQLPWENVSIDIYLTHEIQRNFSYSELFQLIWSIWPTLYLLGHSTSRYIPGGSMSRVYPRPQRSLILL